MFQYYKVGDHIFVTPTENTTLSTTPWGDLTQRTPTPEEIQEETLHFLLDAPLETGRGHFMVNHPGQLATPNSLQVLDASRLPSVPLDWELSKALDQGRLCAVNQNRYSPNHFADPQVFQSRPGLFRFPRKSRVNILALGDVGSTLMMGLKLMGGDVVQSMGICDLSHSLSARWEFEMEQVVCPTGAEMPWVESIGVEDLFDCDLLVFVASKGIPPVGSGVQDVRMAQFQENQKIVAHYAKLARQGKFQGFWAAVSDPVDPLAKVAYLESNRDEKGIFDGKGLAPEQIQGFGLGVMHGRATYYAQRNKAYSAYLTQGRCFGPHGKGLWVANSISHYEEEISSKLSEQVVTANLKMRELGYKPYVAPALSSGALSLLALLRGDWHYGSVFLEGIYLGVQNRLTPYGLETELYPRLPEPLFRHIQEAVAELQSII